MAATAPPPIRYQHHQHCQSRRVRLKRTMTVILRIQHPTPYLHSEHVTKHGSQSRPPEPSRSASNAKRGTKDPVAQHTGSGGRTRTLHGLSDFQPLRAFSVEGLRLQGWGGSELFSSPVMIVANGDWRLRTTWLHNHARTLPATSL